MDRDNLDLLLKALMTTNTAQAEELVTKFYDCLVGYSEKDSLIALLGLTVGICDKLKLPLSEFATILMNAKQPPWSG